jgi:hypothetical protein
MNWATEVCDATGAVILGISLLKSTIEISYYQLADLDFP